MSTEIKTSTYTTYSAKGKKSEAKYRILRYVCFLRNNKSLSTISGKKKSAPTFYSTYVQRALKETPHVNPDCKLIYYSTKPKPE